MTTNMSTDAAAWKEEFTASIKQIDELCVRMHKLLHEREQLNPETWLAVRKVGIELHAALAETIGSSADAPAEKSMLFLCDQVEQMATRLSAWKERGCTGEI